MQQMEEIGVVLTAESLEPSFLSKMEVVVELFI